MEEPAEETGRSGKKFWGTELGFLAEQMVEQH